MFFKKHWAKIVLVIIIVAAYIVIKELNLQQYLSFEQLRKNKDVLLTFVKHNYALSVLLFVLVYALSAAFSVPGASILTMAGGFVFGAVIGAVAVNVGATIGATAAFLFARYLFGNALQEKYKDRLEKFNREMDINGFGYLLTLRFIPLFPFWLINVLAGLTRVPLTTYIWTTSVGIFPGSLVYAFAGRQLTTISSPKDIISVRILLAFMALALFSLLSVFVRKIIMKKRGRV